MKKKILSVVILALVILSTLALCACGKNEDDKIKCTHEGCDGVYKQVDETGVHYCSKDITHKPCIICVNDECKKPIYNIDAEYCPSCGADQVPCVECGDGTKTIDGTYCTECGIQVPKSGRMQFGFDFDALGESATILSMGMVGIFIVTGIIIGFILILNTIVEKINSKKEK